MISFLVACILFSGFTFALFMVKILLQAKSKKYAHGSWRKSYWDSYIKEQQELF